MKDLVPIVLVHGIRTSRTMWRAQVEALRADGFVVVAIDLPGHGTRMGEKFSVDGALSAIDAAVDDMQREAGAKPLLVGLSLGGYFAIHYAGLNGDKLSGLIAASCLALPSGAGLALYRLFARAIHRLPDRGRTLHNTMASLALPRVGVTDINAGGVALDVMDTALAATGTLRPLESLALYRGPLWFMTGGYDHFRLNEGSFREVRPDATMVVIPRATHLVSLVAPEASTAAIMRAAKTLSARRISPDGR